MNGVRSDAAVPAPALDIARQNPNPNDLDWRVNALVVLGRVLQFAAVVTGAVFAYSLLTVSPLYLLAEAIPLIIWAVGSEIQRVRVGHDSSLYFPGYSNPPFLPGQPVGIRNINNNCALSSIVQIALGSPGLNGALDRHPNVPLALVRQQYRAAEMGQKHVDPAIRPEALRAGVARENSLDVRFLFDKLLFELAKQHPVLLGLPPLQPNDNIPELFLTHLVSEFQNPSAASELFIQSSGNPSPIPFAFNHNGNRFEANGFIIHTVDVDGESGHYVAYVKKEHPGRPDPIWWRANDSRVTALEAPPTAELQRAVIVHFRRRMAEV